MNEDKV